MLFSHFSTPLGVIGIEANDNSLVRIVWNPQQKSTKQTKLLDEAHRQLEAFFNGTLTLFSLPYDPQGSPFQLRVWRELHAIPYGQTISYSELAQRIGSPRAVRAVASACRANPLPLIIPCHRVIGQNGSLCGYQAGVAIKQLLLDMEYSIQTTK